MNYEEFFEENNFEQNRRKYEHLEGAERITAIALHIGGVAMEMYGVKRGPITEHLDGVKQDISQGTVREDNAQHSYMLGMLAKELISDPKLGEYFGHLSEVESARYCDVHDLPEIITGDQRTYTMTPEEEAKKEEEEQLAIEYLTQTLPYGMAADLKEYSRQKSPEARYVRHLDKLLPLVVDYLGEGPDVIRGDYKVQSMDEHDANTDKSRNRLRSIFAEREKVHDVLHDAYDILSLLVAKQLKKSFEDEGPEIEGVA